MARKIEKDYPNVDKALYANPRDAFAVEEVGQTIEMPEDQQEHTSVCSCDKTNFKLVELNV